MSAATQLPVWADVLIALMLAVSGATALIGSLSLIKFSDFYKRLHGPAKATTLGVGGVLVASCVYFSVRGATLSVHEFLITLFLFLTTPVSAHLLVKAALHLASVDSARSAKALDGE